MNAFIQYTTANEPEPTDEEVQIALKQMIPTDAGDIYAAVTRIRSELRHARHAQAAAAAKLAPAAPAWQLEPTDEQIRAEMQLTGGTFENCRSDLRNQLRHDARRLAQFKPEALEEIKSAMDEAAEAKERAEAALDDHRAKLEEFEQQINHLGTLHGKIHDLEELALSEADERTLAASVMRAFLKSLSHPSPETTSTYRMLLHELAYRKCISPHVPQFVEGIAAEAADLASRIKADAEANNINIQNLLDVMRSEYLARWPKFVKFERSGAFASLK